jgi:hypothetical protein
MATTGEIGTSRFQWNPKDQPWIKRPAFKIPLSFFPLSLAAFLSSQFFQLRGYQGMIASRLVLYGSGFLVLLFVWMLASSLPRLRKTVGITLAGVVILGCVSLDILARPIVLVSQSSVPKSTATPTAPIAVPAPVSPKPERRVAVAKDKPTVLNPPIQPIDNSVHESILETNGSGTVTIAEMNNNAIIGTASGPGHHAGTSMDATPGPITNAHITGNVICHANYWDDLLDCIQRRPEWAESLIRSFRASAEKSIVHTNRDAASANACLSDINAKTQELIDQPSESTVARLRTQRPKCLASRH